MELYVAGYTISLSESIIEKAPVFEFIENKKYSSIFVLTDAHTAEYCYPILQRFLPDHHLLMIPPGEDFKSIETCCYLWEELIKCNADRSSLLINLGGGVVGDIGGFIAGTFKRGFDFIQMPTTLLSQVDASVGGKVGIDHKNLKNIIGVFNDPEYVFIYPGFLKTLPYRQLRSGFAEVLKHGLIADHNYWKEIQHIDLHDHRQWMRVIAGSVEIKKQIVTADPLEAGIRKILNFGHTIGHAIESWSLQHDADPLLHGESIAIGMVCEAWISHHLHKLSEPELTEITNTIFRYFENYPVGKIPAAALIDFMRADKKNVSGSIRFSLLKNIGACDFDIAVHEDVIETALNFYSGLQ